MDVTAAKEFLSTTKRYELRDHAFGDTEVHWMIDSIVVAYGYFGAGANISITRPGEEVVRFKAEEARELRECGELAEIGRNDETGPDEYVEGSIMPGLTKQAVYEELTTPKEA